MSASGDDGSTGRAGELRPTAPQPPRRRCSTSAPPAGRSANVPPTRSIVRTKLRHRAHATRCVAIATCCPLSRVPASERRQQGIVRMMLNAHDLPSRRSRNRFIAKRRRDLTVPRGMSRAARYRRGPSVRRMKAPRLEVARGKAVPMRRVPGLVLLCDHRRFRLHCVVGLQFEFEL